MVPVVDSDKNVRGKLPTIIDDRLDLLNISNEMYKLLYTCLFHTPIVIS